MSFLKSVNGYLIYKKLNKNFNQNNTVYIYSEGLNYRNYFLSIINKLKKNNIKVLYFTSDESDLQPIGKDINPIFIGNGLIRVLFFATLKCKFLLMTLTDLNNYELKKSKNCKNYAYVFHSLVSTHKNYSKKSFDNYDIIFVNGLYQKRELEKLEIINQLNKKKIYVTGYPYAEFLKENTKIKTEHQSNVLFAPTWSKQKDDLITIHGRNIINTIVKEKKIIFRPHPQSYIQSKKLLNSIEREFRNNQNFIMNKKISDINPYFSSSILITDNGGIALEYVLLFKKPVIFINYKDKIHNSEYKNVSSNTIEDEFKTEFGYIIDYTEIENLNHIINKKLNNHLELEKKIEKFINKYQIDFNEPSNKIVDVIKRNLTI